MTEAPGRFEPRPIDERDEAPHEHGGEPGWSERLSFNFFDATSGVGGLASMEFRPGERRADGALELFLPDGEHATALGREQNAKRAQLSVGRLEFEMLEPLARWRLRCKDVALVFPKEPGGGRGAAAQVELDLEFDAWARASGWGSRRTEIDEQRFLAVVSSGIFEQPGRYAGRLRIGSRAIDLDACGFREKAWGRRERREYPEDIWCAAAFGPDLALSVRSARLSGHAVEHRAVYRDGASIEAMGLAATFEGDDVTLLVEGSGSAPLEVNGALVSTIPARAGEPVRAMARFRCEEGVTLGLVERSGATAR